MDAGRLEALARISQPDRRLMDRIMEEPARRHAEIQAMINDGNRAMQEKAEREKRAAEATIELNERTKVQNMLLSRQVEALQETNRTLLAQRDGSRDKTVSARYEYDVFVSHANDNKQSFVDSLKANLDHLGIRVWYDTSMIDWGDDWKAKIMDGLAKCRFGIVVLSPEFIDREWTEKELSELLLRQNERDEKVVLPLLYNLTVAQMKEKYPSLASVQARTVRDNEDAKDVVIDFARILIRALKSEA